MDREIKAGQVYRNFKGNRYHVIGIGAHEDTEEVMVICFEIETGDRLIINSEMHAIPYADFISKVDKEKYPNSKQEYVFELMEGQYE
ncbi:DUF1653 domain-containing protein [Romboutsia maritimum]|uniref:DUF1653 domain-containing protein n=1 Tax=Romboutsia maritimum TaxID=2020948 RepID=A0A371IQW4_9FIRM|nr:DUF1653 domain-containing protein [Romboutsia maritimum]RDY22866.1 DUF1653 domain-containing protein [Romboutsia maritimum]